ncbi:3-hydroxyacyl-CoA dehydrogenase family protein [Dehalococcoidia bacterium]|nr:3-hydroxyacyl-CoA dehydrogenase family protein [Dehalococcoidia bacterium]
MNRIRDAVKGKIAVVGAGTMGCGIAQALTLTGYLTTLVDVNSEALDAAAERIVSSIRMLISRNQITEVEGRSAISRIVPRSDLNVSDSDIVIEAVFDKVEVKGPLFRELDLVCPANVVFASNTSTIPITELASYTQRPDRFIGMHFFNPVHAMDLIEVIRGFHTSEETMDLTLKLAEALGKKTVIVEDVPGFTVNRVLVPLLNQACVLLAEGAATKEDIDQAVRLGLRHPMGPFQLMDLIGLDVMLDVSESIFQRTSDPAFRPHPLLRKMVQAGRLGRKTGAGWYDH